MNKINELIDTYKLINEFLKYLEKEKQETENGKNELERIK